MNLRESFAKALEARGHKRLYLSRSEKFWQYDRSPNTYYWLGRAGSLRIGHSVSGSIPASSQFKAMLLGMFDGRLGI